MAETHTKQKEINRATPQRSLLILYKHLLTKCLDLIIKSCKSENSLTLIKKDTSR
jgi:hypothetical protein